jgi:hypothetical protein
LFSEGYSLGFKMVRAWPGSTLANDTGNKERMPTFFDPEHLRKKMNDNENQSKKMGRE